MKNNSSVIYSSKTFFQGIDLLYTVGKGFFKDRFRVFDLRKDLDKICTDFHRKLPFLGGNDTLEIAFHLKSKFHEITVKGTFYWYFDVKNFWEKIYKKAEIGKKCNFFSLKWPTSKGANIWSLKVLY